MSRYTIVTYFAIAIASLSSCRHRALKTMPLPAQHLDAVRQEVLKMPSDSASSIFSDLPYTKQIRYFYKQSGDSLFWVRDRRLTEAGDSILQLMRSVRYWGLLPYNYHSVKLLSIKPGDVIMEPQRTEALISDAFFGLMKDIAWGRTSTTLPVGSDSILLSTIQSVANGGAVAGSLAIHEPQYPGYRLLKRAMASVLDTLDETQREVYMNGGMPEFLGTTTVIQAIETNLERWRLERAIHGNHYVLVNIPSNTLSVFVDDTITLESRIITGKRDSPTPELSSAIDCIILYPYWYVPRKIAIEEYLPAIRNDTAFLQRNRFDVLDRKGNLLDAGMLDWEKFNRNNFPVVIRQREGTDNSLGIIKFSFDNPYAVYLHDTNHKNLFTRNRRWLSHGCVRVEKAAELGHYLRTGNSGSEDPSLKAGLKNGKRKSLVVSPAMPLYIRYFTCEFLHNTLTISEDIYRKDQMVADRLYRKEEESL